jgi:hypothetical protein
MSQKSYEEWRKKNPQKWAYTKCREYAKERARRQLAKQHTTEFNDLLEKEVKLCT